MAQNTNPFSTVRTAGLLLPIDLLARVSARDKTLPGITPEDYHLRSGEPLTEAAGRAWAECKAAWKEYREKFQTLPASDAGTTLTRNEWLLPLFQALGYGRLQTKNKIVIEDREYPVSHGWEDHVPVHLLSARYPLDKKSQGIDGAAARSPYSMLQELLNRSPERRWGFVSNGLKLYVLRDNVSLSRAANVEFDLEAMMEGEVYEDFVLLWQLCHQSRVEILPDPQASADSDEPPRRNPENCWLERWSKEAETRGTRALESLRHGVEQAINVLGAGFLTTPGNQGLRDQLADGTLDKQEYYRQLLRTVYRLLLLLVAEEKKDEHDHNLLHPVETSEAVRKRYQQFYSVSRLRDLAGKQRGSMHVDLFEGLKVTFQHLRAGYEPLGIPGFGSFLFNADKATPVLDNARLSNIDLLEALRHLCFTEDKTGRGGSIRRPVDFGNLGSEELGSIYESLLELHPIIDSDDGPFKLLSAAGSERKTTGSYYTPRSLINCLLDSALDPVVHEAIDKPDPKEAEQALLDLKVCDPAAGSGHFLIAAAERMAMHLASLRTGDDQPTTLAIQQAKRDIIGRCIYGVDVNPMAVELCKVSLWMEALEPGRPLSFLDHHIQCGNSLLGTTPALLEQGIPDDAFKPIEGDVKAVASDLKKQNKKERKDRQRGQSQFEFEPYIKLGNLPGEFTRLSSTSDDSVAEVSEKERRYAELVSGADYQNARLLADTWCAVFMWKKDTSDQGKLCPTENDFRRIENNPHSILPHVKSEVRRLADQYHFFHWHVAFPDVFRLPGEGEPENERSGWNDGFDVVVGNPPWERIKLQEKEWFANRIPDVANAANAAARRRMIAALETTDPRTFNDFLDSKRAAEAESHFLRDSARYPLTGVGDVNTYAVFTGTGKTIVSPNGLCGLIVPTGIATDDQLKRFFSRLIETKSLRSLLGFENEEFLFPAVANVVRFCILVMSGDHKTFDRPSFAFYLRQVTQTQYTERFFELTKSDIAVLNPNTRTCPIFRSGKDAELTKQLYSRLPVLVREATDENVWGLDFSTMFHMANDSSLFKNAHDLEEAGWHCRNSVYERSGDRRLPLYEAKLFWHFDHRFGSYELKGQVKGKGGRGLPNQLLKNYEDPEYTVTPRYWVAEEDVRDRLPPSWQERWFIAFRDVTSAKLERTAVFSFLPYAAVGHKAPLVYLKASPSTRHTCCFVANCNSLVCDYLVRQKIGGTSLSYFILKQIPFVPPDRYTEADLEFITSRVVRLVYTSHDMSGFAKAAGFHGEPFPWDQDEQQQTRAELDAYFARLYGLSRDDLEYILDPSEVYGSDCQSETFRVLKEKDVAKYGDFRTRLMVLSAWDNLVEQPDDDIN